MDRFAIRSGRDFPHFRRFQTEGVRAEYMKSVFPTESFPTWQTINTGLYPANHGIIGKVFYDPSAEIHSQIRHNQQQHRQRHRQYDGYNANYLQPTQDKYLTMAYFNHEDERATSADKWWAKSEPVWATAEKNGVNFTAFLWSRCDIPWLDIRTIQLGPEKCQSVYERDESKVLPIQIDKALQGFQLSQDAAFVYDDSLGKAAEEFGPLSNHVERKLRELDFAVGKLFKRLNDSSMDPYVNVIIMGDHGMTYARDPDPRLHPRGFKPHQAGVVGNVRRISLYQILRRVSGLVKMIVGDGAYAMVYPSSERVRVQVISTLERAFDKAGLKQAVNVYPMEEIPDELHWKNNVTTPPVLVLAKPGTVLLHSGDMQKPVSVAYQEQDNTRGLSGYDPDEKDMRSVFMARGPAFKSSGKIYPAIELVDIYQLICNLLNLEPLQNDGVWDRIKAMLRNSSTCLHQRATSLSLIVFTAGFLKIF